MELMWVILAQQGPGTPQPDAIWILLGFTAVVLLFCGGIILYFTPRQGQATITAITPVADGVEIVFDFRQHLFRQNVPTAHGLCVGHTVVVSYLGWNAHPRLRL